MVSSALEFYLSVEKCQIELARQALFLGMQWETAWCMTQSYSVGTKGRAQPLSYI